MTLQQQVRETAQLMKTWTGETYGDLARAWRCSESLARRKLNGGKGGGGTIALADVEKWADHWGLTGAELLSGFAWLQENGRLPHRLRHAVKTGQQITPL